ncbi:MAG: glycerophosphodiester phosphodiesterase [Clostridia bacterium]|nr:glycerophosphodiester phosphodiesterase [Clostridia bacterium]
MKKMKIVIVVALSTAILGTGVFFGVRTMKLNEYKNAEIKLPQGFTITAHTGCMDTKENSLESIKKGIENGATVVEFDLYFTKDGAPVLSHDEPVGGEVTLAEAFEYVSKFDDVKVNVDIKTCDDLGKVYPLAVKYGIEDRIFYTGVKDDFVEFVKKDSPQVEYYLNVDVDKSKADNPDYILSLVEKVKNAGAIGINFNYKGATKELVKTFQENGLLVSIWTVDKEYNMWKIIGFEPDNITTRHPDKLSKIVVGKQ